MMMVPTKILPLLSTRLLSWPTKLRMGLELLRAPKPPAGRSIGGGVRRGALRRRSRGLPGRAAAFGRLRRRPAARSACPACCRASSNWRTAYGSLTRGVLAERAKADNAPAPAGRRCSARSRAGWARWWRRSTARSAARARSCTARAEAVERIGGGLPHRAWTATGWRRDHVVLACEAHSAAALLAARWMAALAELLGAIPYSSSMTVALGFDAADFRSPPGGFGFLVPKRNAAAWWPAPGWAPSSRTACPRTTRGALLPRRHGRCGRAARADEAVIAAVTAELRDIAGVSAQPRFSRISRWPRSMAQYTVGHPARLARNRSARRRHSRPHLAGNAYHGHRHPRLHPHGQAGGRVHCGVIGAIGSPGACPVRCL